PGPGDRAPGDDDVGGTRRGGGGECVPGALRHRVVVTQQRAVEGGGDEPVREGRCCGTRLATGSRSSRPPRSGRSTSGTRTDPSACWWFSRIATMVRGTAHRVPLSVASGRTFLSSRTRICRRRDWNSVQSEVEVSSRYLPWVGIHASQSYLRAAEEPR